VELARTARDRNGGGIYPAARTASRFDPVAWIARAPPGEFLAARCQAFLLPCRYAPDLVRGEVVVEASAITIAAD
jgi:hypothetical protein